VVDASVVGIGVTPNASAPDWWSPSSFNRLHACAYQFAYSTDTELRKEFTKPNTFAALGNASHRLTERAWSNEFSSLEDDKLETALSAAWSEEVQIQFQKLQVAWAPALVPTPRDWPYNSITSRRSIKRIRGEIVEYRRRNEDWLATDRPWVEREITNDEIRLRGTPDRVVFFDESFVVFDLKTGFKIHEMTDSHRRQLLLYAYLISSDTHKKPASIIVLTADGQMLKEEISESDVDECIDDFKSRTSQYISNIKKGSVNSSIATPQPSVCVHCDYRAVCESYWVDNAPEWENSRGVLGRVLHVSSETTLTVEQIYPRDGEGQRVGISDVHHSSEVGDIISIVDAFHRESTLRGRWNTVTARLGR